MTAGGIALVQFLYLAALYKPVRRLYPAFTPELCVGLGYLAANALALALGYLLAMADIFSGPRLFWSWLGSAVLLNLATRRRTYACPALNRSNAFLYFGLGAVLVLCAAVRLPDPVRNTALAGIDSYNFVNYYTWILTEHKAIHYYPSGFALVTSIAPWTLAPHEAARWAPHLVFLACQAAAFGFWRAIGGGRFALALTFLIGAAWVCYPITAYYPHFIQWTSAFVCVPAALFLYARLARAPALPDFIFGILLNIVFVMTAAYFALYTNAVLLLLALFALPLRRKARTWTCVSGIAMVPLLVLLAFYAILAPRFFADWDVGLAVQAEAVHAMDQPNLAPTAPSDSQAPPFHAIARVIASFATPYFPRRWSWRWAVYIVLLASGVMAWRSARSQKHVGVRLMAGLMGFSLFSAVTGIFELRAWQGRSVFVALYVGAGVILWLSFHRWPAPARAVAGSPLAAALSIAFLAIPALIWPPMIGRNIPVSDAIRPRALPYDNRVIAELTRRAGPSTQRGRVAVVVSAEQTTALPNNLLRLKGHARKAVFPTYRLVVRPDLYEPMDLQGFIVACAQFKNKVLPQGFTIHTRSSEYVFALRKVRDRP